MDEPAYRIWLNSQPIGSKTVIDQISSIRRLERAFGDLDVLFAKDRLSGLIGTSLGRGVTLPTQIASSAKLSDTLNTLRQAAKSYRRFKLEGSVLPLTVPTDIKPRQTPAIVSSARKLKPTGFWMFSASPGKWQSDKWAESGETELLYYVSEDDRKLIKAGDLGFLKRNVWRYAPAEIIALFEVVEAV